MSFIGRIKRRSRSMGSYSIHRTILTLKNLKNEGHHIQRIKRNQENENVFQVLAPYTFIIACSFESIRSIHDSIDQLDVATLDLNVFENRYFNTNLVDEMIPKSSPMNFHTHYHRCISAYNKSWKDIFNGERSHNLLKRMFYKVDEEMTAMNYNDNALLNFEVEMGKCLTKVLSWFTLACEVDVNSIQLCRGNLINKMPHVNDLAAEEKIRGQIYAAPRMANIVGFFSSDSFSMTERKVMCEIFFQLL